jgi:hypothetical protein
MAALAAVMTAGALAATACGGASSSSTPSSAGPFSLQTLTNQALAYAKCMRSHGIQDFPDPTVQDNARSKGVGFSMSSVDSHSAQFLSAAKACRKLTGFGVITAAQRQAAMNALLKYSECMRSHGIANFPEPEENGNQIGFANVGIDMNSPRVKAADKACVYLLPGGGP